MGRTGSVHLFFHISIVLLITLSTASGNNIFAQSFDYEEYPKLDYSFHSLELDLGIQPENLRIDGAAKYQVEANVSGADTLILYASHIDIETVSVNDESVDFSLANDSLFVFVDDSSEAGQQYDINIRYSGRPQFGLLKNAGGTVWTSQLPGSQRHWVPIIDNPQVDLQTTLNIFVPSGYQAWATGKKTGEEAASVDIMRYQFKSESKVPASSLAFALGRFDTRSTSYGVKKINLAVEQSQADSIDSQSILKKAYGYLGTIEDYLQFEYPHDRLNIVILEDHGWETKSWGAAIVYVYRNGGDLETQLLRGIIGQWFGVYQREAGWAQADAITLYQTLVFDAIGKEDSTLKLEDIPDKSFTTLYDNFGPDRWNQWQLNISDWQNPSVRSQISGFAPDVLKTLPGIISWRDYADFWYRQIGQPLFAVPVFPVGKEHVAEREPDTVAYRVDYSLNELNGELKLRFESTRGSYSELTTLKAVEIYPDEVDTSEVTFTGNQDSVVLQVDPTIETLQLSTAGHPELVLDEYKPASFLLNEFREGETVERRKEAARKLGYHSENPDLQLAISDLMNKELEPGVKAALLSSMADITNGASGTEQTFLDALQSESPVIRDAGLMALQNYEGNGNIIGQVQSIAQNTDEFGLFKKAVKVLTAIASQEGFNNFVDSVTQQDSRGRRSVFAIQELANMGRVEEAVKNASLFIDDTFNYEIRSRALEILIQHDHSPSDWLTRSEELFDEPDPRIRFLTLQGLQRNRNQEIDNFLIEHMQDEYDARVYRKIQLITGDR